MSSYKSKFEEQIAGMLGGKDSYEQDKFAYKLECTYTPDWKVSDKIYIESKGLFDSSSRRKMKVVKDTYPEVEFIMLFQNPHKRISKASKMTYADWSDRNGFIWCIANELSISEAIYKAYKRVE